jgi:hypothetical protein
VGVKGKRREAEAHGGGQSAIRGRGGLSDGLAYGCSKPMWKPQLGRAGPLRSQPETAAVGGLGWQRSRERRGEGLSPPTRGSPWGAARSACPRPFAARACRVPGASSPEERPGSSAHMLKWEQSCQRGCAPRSSRTPRSCGDARRTRPTRPGPAFWKRP